jgi:cob(I)alamin adenosyltransferase
VKVGAEKPDPKDGRLVGKAWNFASKVILSGEYAMVILDEINDAISYHRLDADKVVETLRQKPEMVHVVLTGRNAHPAVAESADLVTEMREVKHLYQKGIVAQRGD